MGALIFEKFRLPVQMTKGGGFGTGGGGRGGFCVICGRKGVVPAGPMGQLQRKAAYTASRVMTGKPKKEAFENGV